MCIRDRYDDRLLVKPTKSAISYMPTVTYEIPYENAKEMLLAVSYTHLDVYKRQAFRA